MLAPPILTQQHIANYKHMSNNLHNFRNLLSSLSLSSTVNLQRTQSDLDLTMRDLRLMDGTAINRHPVIMPRKTSIVVSLDQTVQRYVCYCLFFLFWGDKTRRTPQPARPPRCDVGQSKRIRVHPLQLHLRSNPC